MKRTLSRFSTALAIAVVSSGVIAMGALPASASTTNESALSAPDCAKVEHWNGKITQTVQVTNNCKKRISWVVNRENGPDSSCVVQNPGDVDFFQWARFGAPWQGITWDCI